MYYNYFCKVDRALGAASAKVELMRQLKLGMETTMPSALLEVDQTSWMCSKILVFLGGWTKVISFHGGGSNVNSHFSEVLDMNIFKLYKIYVYPPS